MNQSENNTVIVRIRSQLVGVFRFIRNWEDTLWTWFRLCGRKEPLASTILIKRERVKPETAGEFQAFLFLLIQKWSDYNFWSDRATKTFLVLILYAEPVAVL